MGVKPLGYTGKRSRNLERAFLGPVGLKARLDTTITLQVYNKLTLVLVASII